MGDRYEEEYRLYWNVCLNAVGDPTDRVQLCHDSESMKREMAREPNAAANPFWLYHKTTEHRTYQRAADQKDLFKLKGDEEYTRMHPLRWQWTIDAVLAEYMYLVTQSKEMQAIEVPLEIQNARANYARLPVEDKKKKKLRIPYEKLRMIGKGNINCWLPKYTGKAMLNLWCHDLCLDRRGTDIKTEIFFDGVRYVSGEGKVYKKEKASGKEKVTSDDLTRPEVEAKQKWSPKGDILAFTLSDYIFHELATGISLSIEITAALMELHPSIRGAALEAFFEKGLAEVTRSKLIYTRIAVARSFFHQLHLEWSKNTLLAQHTYERSTEEGEYSWECPETGVGFEDALDFARQELKILEWSGTSVTLGDSVVHIKPVEEIQIMKAYNHALYKTDQDRAGRGEAVAPWIDTRDKDGTELLLHTRPFSVWHESAPKDDQVLEAMIRYYEGLVDMVEYPLNFSKWKEKSPLNLALFVQTKHDHVPIILDYLKNGDIRKGAVKEKYKKRNEKLVIFKDSGATCIKYFQKVHGRVQEACAAAINT